jgi:RHS repeat-associated protein
MPRQARLDAPGNTVISTGQTTGDPLVRATFGSAYTLDGVGNRTKTDLNEPMMPSYNAETINYTYSLGNILNTADGNTYTHDANGNRIQKSGSGGTTTYTYDSLNRLTQVAAGARTIQYIYNGLGQRIGKVDNGVQSNYLVDPNGILPQVLAETDASNNLISFYVYDGAGLVAKVTPANQYYFYHYDGLGSTIAITDSAGQVVNTYCYSPEGLVGTQETIPNPFTYVGRFGVMAEGNGLYFMRARYYDPEVGRFINKDPIGYAGGDLNLYGYVLNNVINLVDPFGLRIAWGWFIFNNPRVRANLEQLNREIVNLGIPNDEFVLEISGGDRFRDRCGNIISATNYKKVPGSVPNSPHLLENGARGVDLYQRGVSDEVFDAALRKTEFAPEWTRRGYPSGHTHINLPNTPEYYYNYYYNPRFNYPRN